METKNNEPAGQFTKSTRLVSHGLQFWHTHEGLKENEEEQLILEMARELKRNGRCATQAEAITVAAGHVTMYRSNEAGERVPQTARNNLAARKKEELALQKAGGQLGKA